MTCSAPARRPGGFGRLAQDLEAAFAAAHRDRRRTEKHGVAGLAATIALNKTVESGW